ncbi:MAG: hypothetical protein WCO19_03170 [Candidatus Saccharibacteria bacterium]
MNIKTVTKFLAITILIVSSIGGGYMYYKANYSNEGRLKQTSSKFIKTLYSNMPQDIDKFASDKLKKSAGYKLQQRLKVESSEATSNLVQGVSIKGNGAGVSGIIIDKSTGDEKPYVLGLVKQGSEWKINMYNIGLVRDNN